MIDSVQRTVRGAWSRVWPCARPGMATRRQRGGVTPAFAPPYSAPAPRATTAPSPPSGTRRSGARWVDGPPLAPPVDKWGIRILSRTMQIIRINLLKLWGKVRIAFLESVFELTVIYL